MGGLAILVDTGYPPSGGTNVGTVNIFGHTIRNYPTSGNGANGGPIKIAGVDTVTIRDLTMADQRKVGDDGNLIIAENVGNVTWERGD